MKLQELREQSGLKQAHVAKMAGIDAPILSKIEKGRILPTPLVLRRICETLYQNPLDIYEKHEIDLIGCMSNNRPVTSVNKRNRPFIPKVQFKRNSTACKCLKRDILKSLGYESAQNWFDECIESLKKRIIKHNGGV